MDQMMPATVSAQPELLKLDTLSVLRAAMYLATLRTGVCIDQNMQPVSCKHLASLARNYMDDEEIDDFARTYRPFVKQLIAEEACLTLQQFADRLTKFDQALAHPPSFACKLFPEGAAVPAAGESANEHADEPHMAPSSAASPASNSGAAMERGRVTAASGAAIERIPDTVPSGAAMRHQPPAGAPHAMPGRASPVQQPTLEFRARKRRKNKQLEEQQEELRQAEAQQRAC